MKKIICVSLFMLFFLIGINVHADTGFLTTGGRSTTITLADRYYSLARPLTATLTDETSASIVIPSPTIFSGLAAQLVTAPDNGGGTQSVVYMFRKNGADTALTCTISESNTTCSDTTNSVIAYPGDTVTVKVSTSGTPVLSRTRIFVKKAPLDNDNRLNIISADANSAGNILSASAVRYISLFGKDADDTETDVIHYVSENGVIKNLYVRLVTAPDNGGGTQSYVFVVRKNGANTTLTCTISETSTSCRDILNSFSVVKGDYLSISVTPSGTPTVTTAMDSVVYETDTPALEVFSVGCVSGSASISATSIQLMTGETGLPSGNDYDESLRFPQNVYVKRIYAAFSSAPNNGAGIQSYQIVVYNVTDGIETNATCTASETETSCEFTGSELLNASEKSYVYRIKPSGTPASGIRVRIAMSYSFNNSDTSNINGY